MKNYSTANHHRFPGGMRLGFCLLALGLLLDLGYHAVLAVTGGETTHSDAAATAVHGVVLAGMAVTFGGLLQVAFKPHKVVDGKETK